MHSKNLTHLLPSAWTHNTFRIILIILVTTQLSRQLKITLQFLLVLLVHPVGNWQLTCSLTPPRWLYPLHFDFKILLLIYLLIIIQNSYRIQKLKPQNKNIWFCQASISMPSTVFSLKTIILIDDLIYS